MKRIFLYALMTALLMGCHKQEDAITAPRYTGIDWENINNGMCCQDQWLRIPSDIRQTEMICELADVYNADVVMHSAYSDMEIFCRWDVRTDTTMREMDLSVFYDQDTKEWASRLLTAFAEAQADTTFDPMETYDDYEAMLYRKYRAACFIDTTSITEEMYWAAVDKSQWVSDYDALFELRGQDDSLHQAMLIKRIGESTDINERLTLALEYAHSSSEGPYFTEAIPYLEQAMMTGEYSPLLREAWQTWRALLISEMGASKDSDIPNAEFNQMRLICCTAMLRQIAQHPDDWTAINNYLVTGYLDNILRFGQYMFGNQGVMVQMQVFPAYFERILGRD